MTFGISIVMRMNGIAFLETSSHLPVLPHMIPKTAKRNPESPIVESPTYIGRKLAATATMKAKSADILFLMPQSAIRLTAR